jgi:hypothetical protein
MRSCTSATKSLGSVIIMVQDFNVSPVATAFDAGLVAFVAVGLVWTLT